MISKALLKELCGYKLQKKCDAEGLFVVEGVKMAGEAMASGWRIAAVCATEQWMAANQQQLVADKVYEVTQGDLERLSGMQSPNEVWMLVERGTLQPADDGMVIVLDHLQDPGNMGTIIRTADWLGIRHIVCSRDTVSCYNPKVVQASMGGIFRTAIEYCDLRQWLADYRYPIYGTRLQGDDLYGTSLTVPCAVVVGNESRGISAEVCARLTRSITIPNRGGSCESLNASVATAIVCSEIMRQNSLQSTGD